MKRKLLAILTTAIIVFAFTACGQEEQTEETTQATTQETTAAQEASEEMQHTLIINNEPYCIAANTCDDRGFTYVIADATDKYSFTSVNESDQDVSWTVYVMDEEFDDATRYIAENESPALEGDGTLEIKEGQYIYVCCSANAFSVDADSVPENAWLEINYAE